MIMRHAWWIVNSSLLLFLVAATLFILLSRQPMPRRISFEPDTEIKPVKREIAKIDLNKIYSNDLFDTYRTPITPVEQPESAKPMPPPPSPKPSKPPVTPPPKFLEPLQVSLKGIIVGADEKYNVAIIEDAKEKRSKNYRVNDKIEDAQLIRIFKNKIILIRSNGQQETLYVNQHDAEVEQLLSPINNWSSIIQKNAENSYTIDPDLFVERITNLAQFIDMLNLTTVYRQGLSIGIRIGKMQPGTPGIAMGLLPGDIIQTVNNIPANDTKNRFEIYQTVIKMQIGDTISVNLLRKKLPMTISYTLAKLEQPAKIAAPIAQPAAPSQPENQPPVPAPAPESTDVAHLIEERRRYAHTARDMQKEDRRMLIAQEKNNKRLRRNVLIDNVQPDSYG